MCCKFKISGHYLSNRATKPPKKNNNFESRLPQNTVGKCFTMLLLSKVSRFHLMTPVCQLCLLYYAEGFHVRM